MAVLSKLQLLNSTLTYKNWSPAFFGIFGCISIAKLYSASFRNEGKGLSLSETVGTGNVKKSKASLNAAFFAKLKKLLRILIPGPFSTEVFYMIVIGFVLLARTIADVYMITNATSVEASIIDRSPIMFAMSVFKYFLNLPAISLINALLKFSLSELKLRFRENLTKHLYGKYLGGFTYYQISNLDSRIQNPDQLLTQDVEKFCDGIVELYSNLSKPILDVFLYVFKLGRALGWGGPGLLFGYLMASMVVLTKLRRPIAKLTVQEQVLEGEYRYVNSRLIMNSEEIAFYQGNKPEKLALMGSFNNLVFHLRKTIMFRFTLGFVDNIVGKYITNIVGWMACAKTFFDVNNQKFNDMDRNELMQELYNNGRMMLKLSEALGRLALAGRDMTRLSGFTTRVDTLMKVLDDMKAGRFEKAQVADENGDEYQRLTLKAGNGKLVAQDNIIKFDEVPLVTPNGDVLIESLSFEVPSGRNVLVCGPNGCGKSSLFRTLGELWPVFGGTLTKPAKGKLFYVPQRPYMTLGTLRDQVIYPDTAFDMKMKGLSDKDLEQMLENVQLTHILEREGGWSAVQDWMDVLSGGEKQRIAMARLFYHKPQFAILDECTSAVSVDVEGAMYRLCREMNITLFTVSHRKSLWKYHEYSLYMDGRGSYRFEQIDDQSDQFGS
uniref:ABC transporter domain-containing protein n=1 Tax=Caenorhabditis tropicalis TaxID=1561998 RepID=A0A1I7TV65_9PELO